GRRGNLSPPYRGAHRLEPGRDGAHLPPRPVRALRRRAPRRARLCLGRHRGGLQAGAADAMKILVLGACGTFMGGIAALARELGHEVIGVVAGTYPPMDRLLAAQGIPVREGYTEAALEPAPDLVLVGNALSRGNPCVEAVLNRGLPYQSGP